MIDELSFNLIVELLHLSIRPNCFLFFMFSLPAVQEALAH